MVRDYLLDIMSERSRSVCQEYLTSEYLMAIELVVAFVNLRDIILSHGKCTLVLSDRVTTEFS